MSVNIFRYKQALDDPTILFWSPRALSETGEWPYIYFLKLDQGQIYPNKDVLALQKIDRDKVSTTINALEVYNKKFIYAKVMPYTGRHAQCLHHNSLQFDSIYWDFASPCETRYDIELLLGFSIPDYPYVIAVN